MSRRNLSLLLAIVFACLACVGRSPRNPHARYVAEGFEKIDELALDRPADRELVAGAMRGMVDVLRRRGDEHTSYFRPQAAQRYRDDLSGGFGGVGVRVSMLGDPPEPTIVGPPEPGTPAFHGGVQPADRIVAIDGEPVAGLTINDIVDRMRGDVGQVVTLSLVRGEPASEISIALKREIISVPSVLGDRRLSDGSWQHLLEQDQRIALVRIETFGDKTFDEMEALLPRLQKAGMRAMVVDLRDNPGGALDVCVDVCDLFLPPQAEIVETRDRRGKVDRRYTATGNFGTNLTIPMAVLINKYSASASEIMAAALQDNHRAVVIGQRSFGKGTVQQLEELEAGRTMLKITTASFWRPSDADIHRRPDMTEDDPWGVSPDEGFEVLVSDEQRKAYLDARAARDLRPVDESKEFSTEESIKQHLEAHAKQTHSDHADPPPELIDPILERAVQHLQSLLDGSAKVPAAPGGKSRLAIAD